MNDKNILKQSYENFTPNAASLLHQGIDAFLFLRHLHKWVAPFLLICFSFFSSLQSSAQFCQTWSLAGSTAQTANSGASTNGNTEIIGSGMSAPAYGTYQSFPKPGGVNWPSVVNTANGIYLEFPITPSAGNNLVITSITFSAYENNGSGTRLTANLYNGTTATGVTADITSTSAGAPTNVSMTGLSIPVANGTTAPIRFYITGNNSRTLNIQNVVICGTSTAAYCADATLGPGTAVAAGNIGNGTTNNILTNFSIGASTNLTLTNYSFPFTGGALAAADLVNYRFWYSSTNSFASATVLSTVTTGLAASPINFGGFSQAINSGTAGYFWVTANIAGGAIAGHSITASAFTPANLTFLGGPTTCGSVGAQGTKTIAVLTVPTVTTSPVSAITSTTATAGGNISNDGGSPITQSGVIYSTGPITDSNSTTGGAVIYNAVNGVGPFSTSLTGLQPGTTYYVTTFAVNAAGISYGVTQTFTTPPTPPRNCNGSGPLNGSAAKEGVFFLYAYAKAGEKIDWNVIRTDDGGAGNWVIDIYTPTGFQSTCTIGTAIGNQCTTAQITVTAATEGIWTLRATPAGNDGNDVVCPALNVYNAGGTNLPGRVWTESLHGHDASTGVEPDFTLYFLTPSGYEYSATYSGMNGLNYTIVSDTLGVRTAAGSCTSAYQSVSYSGANPLLGPDNANCGKKNKIFFAAFATDLPPSAPRFNIAAGSGQVIEPLINEPVVPKLSDVTFIRPTACSSVSNINFTVTNFTGKGVIYIDVNNNGVYTDPVDRIDTVLFVNGVNSVPFNGLDGLGNPIPSWRPITIKIAIEKIGETHFVQSDIEIFGGIRVTRLNGPGAPDNTVYWNDTNLPVADNCFVTPLLDASAGVNSSGGGVHNWDQCGTCSPQRATCGSTNNSTINNGSWGNQRLIDNWTSITDSTLNRTLYINSFTDTTLASVCPSQLPYIWHGHSYNAGGTFYDTLTSSVGCDSLVTLILTVNNCSFGDFATAPYIGTCNNKSVSSGFYNTTGTGVDLIGTNTFTGTNLGAYIQNSGYLILNGGEVKTFKNALANVCGATMYYTAYLQGSRPVNPVFTTVPLPFFDLCSGSTFPTGGPCSPNDQKWQRNNLNFNLTTRPPGNYTIEVYYQVVGDDNSTSACTDTLYVNNSGNNFTASFSIVTPPTISYAPSTFCASVNGPQPVNLSAFPGGVFSASPAGLNINSTTGSVTPSLSSPGTYTVKYVFDLGQNCPDSVTTTVTITPPPVIFAHGTNPSCIGICDGTATVDVVGGTAPYTYSWDNGGSTKTITNLCEGAYVVTVTDASNCAVSNSPIVQPGCFQIKSILVDACSPNEYDQEMVFFQVGQSPLNSALLNVTWPTFTASGGVNDPWQGLCTNQAFIDNVNATITAGGHLLPPPPSGILPAGANVVLITSNALSTSYNSFANLADTVYVLFQCANAANNVGHFANNGPTATRRLVMNFGAGCTDTVNYDTAQLVNINGTHGGSAAINNGAYVNYTPSGAPGYFNYGCTIPYQTLTAEVVLVAPPKTEPTFTPIAPVCQGAVLVLPGSSTNAIPVTGTWNPAISTTTPGTSVYTFTPTAGQCADTATISITVKATTTSTKDTAVCQNNLPYVWNGNSYGIAGSFKDTLVNAAGCDSILTLNLTIKNQTTSTTNVSVCAATLPYNWNGTPYNAGGSFVFHTTNAAGCDSAATLNLTILTESVSTTNVSVCAATLPYNWNGTPYNAGGSFVFHTTNAAGCDSAATLNLTILNETTSTTNVSVCAATLPYNWNGTPYNAGGSFVFHTTNAAGCDSAATLNLTILTESVSTTNVSVCAATLPYNWNGTPYNAGGSFVFHTTNAAGCDSAATLNLTILNETTSTTNVSVCAATLPYNWNGTPYNAGGSFVFHTTNAAGCDSAATLNLTILNETTSTTNVSVCAATLPYNWNGTPYNAGGSFVFHTTNAAGCDSAATLNLTILNESVSTTNVSVCAATLPYNWNGTPYNAGGSFVFHTTNAAGCDSAATLNLTILNETTSTTAVSVCAATLPYNWNGTPYNAGGSFVFHTTNAAGCDSAATLNLTILNETTSTTNVSVCAATLPYNWNGTPYNAGGSFVFHTTNAAGCDSAATLNLTILNESVSTTNVSVCAATLPYNWNGTPYNAGGSFVFHTTNAAGCDSAATLNLTILNETTSTTAVSVCAATLPYNWNGTPYNAGGSFVFHTTNAAGCDSAATLNLTILNETTSTTAVSVCAATLPYNWNGTPYNAGGSFVFHTTNAAGCDSAATLNLTILNETTSTTNVSVCAATLPYNWNGTPYNAGGSFVFHTTNAAGCDSAATLNLTILNETTSTTAVSVCAATLPYNWNGTPYNAGGSFVFHTTNAAGCDSAATLNLTILNETTSTTNVSVCAATLPYNWNGTPYNAGGSFVFHTTNAAGCDSAATLNLTILNETTSTTAVSVCAATLPYNWNGTPYNAGGSFVFHTTNAAGCDSAATLNLTILNETTSTTNVSVCAATLPYNWNGTPYNAGGSFVFHTTNAAGCDSAATLNLTILNETTSTTAVSVCAATLPYNWNGTPYNAGGSFVFHTTNAAGCDSAATLNLTILNETTSTTAVSVCAATLPYNWNGTPYNAGGSFVFHTTNAAGCDSAATLNLTILNETTSTTNVSVCAATLPYNWNGTPYNAGGSFVFHTTNAAGCDSAATLNLTILNETTSTTAVSVCAATLPYNWNGTPYNAGGSFVFHTTNAAGCDSAATLNLTILNETTSTTAVSVCAATLPYNWNGTPYNAGGSFVFHTTNAAGCDSAATLNLTILNETTSTTNVSVCAATLPYNWNGTPYNAGGSFVFHTTNAAGCDSAATLNLTILNETTSTTAVSVCAATLPYNWNGTPYNAGGSFVFHTTNAAGCDSAATLNLTILNETTSTTAVSVCAATLPYNWNGTPYNAGGSFVFHTTNAAGCDSAATLNLTILNETTSTTNVSVCAATLPYNWNGTPYNAGGSFVFHTTNAAGCDSAATLNLTILNETTSTTAVSVCAATLPYNWNGTPYNAGGSFVFHTTNAAGCDSAATLNLTILNETTSTTNVSVCAATLPYNWNGTPYNAGGSFVFHTTNAAGCDSAATLNLTILNETTSTTAVSVCAATLPYNWNGTPYNAGGSFVFHTTNAAGCDSAATLNLTILNETTSTTNVSVCAATLPYNWNGTPYNAGGSFVFHTTNAAGCDSAATLNLTILNETTSTTNVSVCAATLPYNWNGTPYNAGGSFVFHTTNAAGCDSAATLNLTILNETTSTTAVSVCAATLPYNWNGTPYNAGGSFVFHTTNAAGCDSAATLNLTILNETTSTTNVSVCAATLPYNWNGTPYNAGGSFVFHTTNAAGCDSAATLNLTILNETTSTTAVSVCAATLPYNWNGTPYNAGGSFVFHTTNAAGCDSAATLNLTILNETTSTTNVSVCAATLPYNWNGTPYNAGGSFVFHTTNAAGCDSAATLNLTILNETTSTTAVSVCAATLPYNWNGTPYNAGGSFVFHTTNAAGCDSAATLNLTILNETTSTTAVSVCAATLPYNWNGTPYNAGGSFVFHTTNAAGCDSAATLNLTILNETTSTTNVSVCAATLPYNWNGTPYNAGGSFVFHITNAAGCDSAATLNLTILNETTSTTAVSVCAATLPYNWNGTPYNAGGSFVFHTTNAAGCDSAATLNLTILNETTSTTAVSVCAATLPYNWNGTPYNAGGSFVFHTTNAAGCDSAATLNLTILNETTSTTNVSVCAATLPYNWNGTPYNAGGSFVFHTTNAAGCDSAATLNLTILNETTSTTNVSVCAATLPYNWNGTPYNAGGSFVFHTTNAAGCDSAATLNLTILNETTSTTAVSVCAATLPYNWNGTPYNAGGSFVFHTTNAAGCDSAATLNLTILNETTSTTNVSVCAATLPYNWNGTPYNAGGSFVFHTTNAAGCDSAATLNLTILNETTSTTNVSVCAATLPYNWNGTPYNAGGSFVFHTTNAAGCDSAATLNLTILNESVSTTNVSVCAATLPYNWNGTPYNAGGSFVFHTTNAAGCDSAATLNLTILNETTSTTAVSVCAATLPYNWNGTPYNAGGSFVFHTTNAAGCDSAATLNLTILNETTSTTNVSVCAATLPYNWNSTPYNAGGSFVFHTTNAAGCDSAATLNLTILNETTSTTAVSVCTVSLPYVWNGNSYSTGGSYIYHTTNAAGCDSAATLNLAIVNETTSVTNVSVCAATLPYIWNSTPYNAGGSYVYHTTNAAGCDSAATLNLAILNASSSTTDIVICSAQLPYTWNGNSYNAAGSYSATLINAAGCDSVATLNLSINPVVTSTTDITICNTQLPYTWNSNSYNAAGSYSVTLTNVAGCDSVATLNLTVSPQLTSTTDIIVCSAQLPYLWNGNNYNAAGSYTATLVSASGCDSIATLNLAVNIETTSITNISVCPVLLPYVWNGTPYNAGGSYTFTTTNAAGCDSVATLNLTVLAETVSTTAANVCAASLPYVWNGNSYSIGGTYIFHTTNAAGCDSAATLNLAILNGTTSTTNISVCAASLPYVWNANSYSAAGSYIVTLVNAAGCDSVAILNLAVNPQVTSATDIAICTAQLPYTWNGNSYAGAGSYSVTLVSVAGCDSVATLNLSVNPQVTSTTDIAICTAQLPYTWNGNSYAGAGSYSVTLVNVAGCDSVATLNLSVNPQVTSATDITICNSQLPYLWNGNNYNAAGSYNATLVSASGCDSVATLNLIVNNAVTSNTNIAICNAQLPYSWNGNSYNAAGSYTATLISASGCDSVATLNLAVANETTSITNASVCATSLPYIWNGNNYSAAGSYVFNTTNAAGCDSAATLNLIVNPTVTSSTDLSICPVQLPYTWNGTPYNAGGSYSATLVSAAGCDSVATLNLTVNSIVTSTTDISICLAQLPYNWNGNNYNAAGSYSVTLINVAGCDSIATLNLTVNNAVTSTTDIAICNAQLPYSWNGNNYNAAGSYNVTLVSASGCDSISTLNLIVNNAVTSTIDIAVCNTQLPYSWNGNSYNAAGSYNVTLVSASGCDSIATLNLTVNNAVTSTTDIAICNAQLPYSWNGNSYNAAGSYNVTLVSVSGCDSIATLNLTVNNAVTSSTDIAICNAQLPYSWNGNSYNAAGSYNVTLVSASGCDSIATLNLTVNNVVTSSTDINICPVQLPYVWNGNNYSAAGSYSVTLVNAAGCDSVATLNLIVNPVVTSTTDVTICTAQLPYAWNGNNYNSAGSYNVTLINVAGCDSIATLNLTVNNAVASTTDISICNAQLPYSWNSNSYNAAGSYNVILVSAAGCDSIATLNLTVNNAVTSVTDIAICNAQLPYSWNSNSYNAAGSYNVTLVSASGCDSIATLNLTVNNAVTSSTDIDICPVQLPYIWNGNNYNAAGSYNVTLVSAAGCDSIATLNLTVNPVVTSTTDIAICTAQLPYSWNGNSYNAAGSYSVTLINVAGCDSIATLNLAVSNTVTSITTTTICNAQLPYSWNGNNYNAAGSYNVTLVSAAGCDSIATLNLIVNNAVTSTTDIAICAAQLPYSWNGNNYNAAGSYNATLVSASGCDSIATLNLTVNNAVASTTNITICNAQLPYSWNGNSYNAAGSYNVTLVSATGCDSVATLNLTINNAVTSATDITICPPQLPYTWNGQTYSAAGTYTVTLVSSAGCDSVATLNLFVNAIVTSTTDISICTAQLPYSWNGNSYNAAGSYNVTLVNVAGCDSIATLNLTVNSQVTSTTNITICNTILPYNWNGNSYNAAGSYNVTLVSAAGCDSVATLNLTVNNAVASSTDITICSGQLPFSWNGNSYITGGFYTVTLVSASGCDSVATLHLLVNDASQSTTNIAICNTLLPYSWNGNTYNAAGAYSVTLVGANGCDSIAVLNLTVNNTVTSTTDVTVCNTLLPYSWNGNSYNVAGSYSVTLVSATGCDSIATLNLTVNNAVTSTTDINICPVQLPYNWNGNSYNAAGSYSVTLVSATGCDSVATLNLTVSAVVTSTTDITICTAQLPYSWNGNSYNAAGSYSVTLVNVAGCDSIATLNLTVNNVVTSTTNVTVCNTQLPYSWNGNSYNAAGSYNVTLVSASGCDSVATLNLVVNNAVTSNTDVIICNAQLPYSWNGNNYNAAGSYTVTLVSASGCDSVATLNLVVNNAVTSNTDVIICNAQLPYSWNGNSYNAAGLYNVTLVSASGCDSIATLNLVVNSVVTSTTDINICPVQLPYSWNGNSYNAAGLYNVTLVSAAGCDSIATLNLTVSAVVTSTTDITICTAQLPYSWNGNSYNAAGSYSVTLVNIAGCDSIATLNLIVNNVVTSTTNVAVCNTQLPYSWNGNNYNASGSYNATLVSASGCDSIATLNLTINNAVTSDTDVAICSAQLPYNWNGNSYNAAGSYNVTLVSASGCDSIATLNLTVNNAVASTTNIVICNSQLPYSWNGNNYNAAGLYNVTLVSASGCDSIATLNLVVNNVVTSTTDINICPVQLPYNWNGNSYNAAGLYNATLVSASGCDSVATLNLTVSAVVTSATDITICAAQLPYSWNGNSYNAAGTYSVTLVNVAGCDSIATLNLIVNNVVTSTIDVTVCNTQLPYLWNGNSYNAAGSYNVTLVSASGCDSVATLNLTVNNAVTSTTDIAICAAQLPYNWNGNSYNAAGSYNVTLVSTSGCDSIATLHLVVNNVVTSTTDINICPVQLPYSWNGNSYNAAGSYNVTLVSATGCDSVATLNLTVSAVVTSTTDITICTAQLPYSWNGNSYNAAGSYSVTLVNIAGCDSVATLNLTVSAVVTSTTDITICTAQLPYSWNGNSYNAAGSYSVTLVNIAGCDSIATLNLTVNNAVTSTTNIAICNAQLPYNWNGNLYNAAGSYNVTLISASGCDSIATLNLAVNNATSSTTNIAICTAQLPYSWNGNTYNAAGSFNATLVNANGCDSVATLNLTVNNATASTTNITICNAQLPYSWNGNNYNTAGLYNVTLVNVAGCDSVATLNLVVNNAVTSNTDINICPAQLPYSWNGNSYNAAGSYNVTLPGASGCDSIATLNLTVSAVVTSTTNIAICNAQLPYSWNGNTYAAAGSYSVTLINVAGCDSVATLNLAVNNSVTSNTNITICTAQLPYSWNGNSHNAAGSYNATLVSASGCDSIATLNLVVLNETTSTTTVSVCAATLPYNWNGTPYNATGAYIYHTTNAAGCDSTATLNLTVKNETASTTNISICPVQLPYNWNGNTYITAGIYNVTLANANGCDSVATLNLAVNTVVTSTTNINVCAATLPYSWNGTSYNVAGTYEYHTTNVAGCDSIATLNLSVANETTSIANVSACAATLPYVWNGNNYNSTGSYVYHTTNAGGCDSTATLNLTVLNETSSVTNINVCAAILPYIWNGNSYSATGSYIHHTSNAAGCDSAATLNLTVLNETNSLTNVSVCAVALPYLWNGNSYNTAGTYAYHTNNAVGCDSAATLVLTVLNATSSNASVVNVCRNSLPYVWNGNSYNASGAYTYHTMNAAGCDSTATLNLTVNDAVTSITQIKVCDGQLPYTWNGQSYNTAGTYTVIMVSNAGCDSVATLELAYTSAVTQNIEITGCNSVLYNGQTYTSPTTFTETIYGTSGCDSVHVVTSLVITNEKFDVAIAANPNPPTIGEVVTVTSSSATPYNVLSWEPSDKFAQQNAITQQFIADSAMEILLTAQSTNGCIAKVSLLLKPMRPTDFWMPNAFTPNGDGDNDFFSAYGTTIKQGLLRVYNQWGQLIFETTDIKKGWDGKYKGVVQPVGVYAYVVFAEMYNGSKLTDKGFINLIR